MKKIALLLFVTLFSLLGNAQQFEILYVQELYQGGFSSFCAEDDDLLGVIVYGVEDCNDDVWWVRDNSGFILDGVVADSIVINNPHEIKQFYISMTGCYDEYGDPNFELSYTIGFSGFASNPFSEPFMWKRQNESIVLSCSYSSLNPIWSTGETGLSIEVSDPGTYSVTLTNQCGPVTYSVEVRDNVEIYRATTDLVTNKNQVTWQTTPEQSAYISAVKVYRNNELVGTVPYADGVFTDNMGSENTQWQYHIVGVSVEGDDCPIPSYWKRTIHLDRVLGAQGQYILQWTPYEEESPAKDEVTAYGIYDVVNGVPNHVIDVGYFTNVYAYNPADFHGYGAVAAIFAEKGLEELAFSNLTKELLTSVGENPAPKMSIYPNPTNGEFTVDGPQTLTIFNTMGQVVATSYAENGVHTISLSSVGVYFVKSDEGIVRKVVVK